MAEAGIRTLSDVRLADQEEIAAIEGISHSFAERMKDIVGEPSEFDIYSFEFIGAAKWTNIPSNWSRGARHYGIPVGG